MDRQKCRRLRAKLAEILDIHASDLKCEFGVEVNVGGGSFSGSNVTFKTEFSEIGTDGVANTAEVEAFKRLAYSYGLKPEDLGRKFMNGGQEFEICGLNPKARRYPIVAKNAAGKVYKFNKATVLLSLGRMSQQTGLNARPWTDRNGPKA